MADGRCGSASATAAAARSSARPSARSSTSCGPSGGRNQGGSVASERQTVGAYLATWLEGARPKLRPRTWIRYEQLARVHAGSIAKVPLAKLGPQHIERLYAERLAAGSAPMTVRHLHALLHGHWRSSLVSSA